MEGENKRKRVKKPTEPIKRVTVRIIMEGKELILYFD